MSRWTVCRKNTMFIHPDEDDVCYGPRWCIISPIGVKWEDKATFSEAIACADEQARTREYVLPRVGDTTFIDENDLDTTIFSVDDAICISQPRLSEPGEVDVIAISSELVEEVSLALLAHTERLEK